MGSSSSRSDSRGSSSFFHYETCSPTDYAVTIIGGAAFGAVTGAAGNALKGAALGPEGVGAAALAGAITGVGSGAVGAGIGKWVQCH
ncbi:hypothetical protein D1093_05045 [Bartonella kosoyi]|uniref:Uncharacterized protein n=1 Tax=Bartonella kosoyi TaxID=2133959 RepID=A0A5B9CX06_9HYPH|nr:hypothetical protein [Bartonella kosoyi]QEE08996.1 hypothetical protein D1093_05045 [Bartonella kosoyi]